MQHAIWELAQGDGPVVATAIHDGHAVRPELSELLALSEAERRREEDPYTAAWTGVVTTRLVGVRSRFEVDLNRPRDGAVYLQPADAWGLTVWKQSLPPEYLARSLAEYDAFYTTARELFASVEQRYGPFVVLDLHTYNHRRAGPNEPPAEPADNPEVNIGTGPLDRTYWAPVVDRFIRDLRAADFLGRSLDVRENVRFRGGELARFVARTFPRTGCVLAIEFKKFFMDEWTDELDQQQHRAIAGALRHAVAGLSEPLGQMVDASPCGSDQGMP